MVVGDVGVSHVETTSSLLVPIVVTRDRTWLQHLLIKYTSNVARCATDTTIWRGSIDLCPPRAFMLSSL